MTTVKLSQTQKTTLGVGEGEFTLLGTLLTLIHTWKMWLITTLNDHSQVIIYTQLPW